MAGTGLDCLHLLYNCNNITREGQHVLPECLLRLSSLGHCVTTNSTCFNVFRGMCSVIGRLSLPTIEEEKAALFSLLACCAHEAQV